MYVSSLQNVEWDRVVLILVNTLPSLFQTRTALKRNQPKMKTNRRWLKMVIGPWIVNMKNAFGFRHGCNTH